MTTYTYTGKLTDYGGAPFPTAEPVLWVEPASAGFSGGDALAGKRIPVTVAANGTFSVALHASASVTPEAIYTLKCQWLGSGHETWSDWATFKAAVGGGDIGGMTTAQAPAWSILAGFGPPPPGHTGAWLDLVDEKITVYAPESGGY